MRVTDRRASRRHFGSTLAAFFAVMNRSSKYSLDSGRFAQSGFTDMR